MYKACPVYKVYSVCMLQLCVYVAIMCVCCNYEYINGFDSVNTFVHVYSIQYTMYIVYYTVYMDKRIYTATGHR